MTHFFLSTAQQLDGVLRATDKHGQRVSMSHKCTELDRQIPLLLGVSKAILENVVFCHQEDASWPLQEGSVLKKKFDDIFDSTRYTKALEVFTKIKKEYTLKGKDHKAVVAELRSHRHAAKSFRTEVQKHSEQLEELEEQMATGRQALEENQEEQERVMELTDQVEHIIDRLEAKENEMLFEREGVSTQRRMIQEDLTDQFNEKELTEQLKTFDAQKESHKDRKRDLEEQAQGCRREIDEIRNQQTELQSEVGRLQAGKEANTENLKKRYEKMVDIGKTYGLEEMVTQISQNSQLAMGTAGGRSSTQDTNTSFYSRHHTHTQGDESTVFGSPVRGGGGGGSINEQGGEGAILDIPRQDMKEYFRAVGNKEEELQGQVSTQKSKIREQEDEMNNDLSDLKGKVKSIESKKKDLFTEETKARKELEEIRRQSQKGACVCVCVRVCVTIKIFWCSISILFCV